MAFMFWIFLLLPAMLLVGLVNKFIVPFIGPLRPVLDWLFRPEVFYTACKVLIAVNIMLFTALLVVGHRQKKAGKLAWSYVDSFRGWKRLKLIVVKLFLFWGPIWELGMIAFFFLLIALRVVGPWS